MHHQGIRVVLQVLTHTGQVVHQRDVVLSQLRCRAHAGKLENLWGVDGAAGEDHFIVGFQSTDLALVFHFHADSTFAIEQYPVHQGVGHDGQVGTIHDRVQIGPGHAATLAVLLVHLVHAHAFLDGIIEVIGGRVASLNTSFHKGSAYRVVEAQVGNVELAVSAVELTLAGLIVFAAFEHRQHIVEAPAFVAQ